MRIASLAFEILPLVALFIGNSIYNIFIGAAASVGLAAVILLFTWLKEKRLARFVIFSVLISTVLTITAFWAENSLFIKIQPSLFNGLMSLTLLLGWCRGVPVMRLFFGSQFHLTESVWMKLSKRWCVFFIFLVLANELAWRNLADDEWVIFKVFFVAPATGLFMLSQLPLTISGRVKAK
jgi:intracellular septation protein